VTVMWNEFNQLRLLKGSVGGKRNHINFKFSVVGYRASTAAVQSFQIQ